jgi:glycosyltransferase involved in cell wall biosynthesis
MTTMHPRALRTIVVDLTPVLPGGENGGAKVFALELVRRLAAFRPDTRFVLLTQASSHEELAVLDAPNVARRLSVGSAATRGRAAVHSTGTRFVARMPEIARAGLMRAALAAYAGLRRREARRLLRELEADLLFCPFTSPTYDAGSVPVVCTVHDAQHRAYPQFFTVEDAAQRDRAFLTACRRATRIAADSDHTRRSVVQWGGAAESRVRTVAIRLPVPDAGATVPRGRHFIYPANFWRHKNHEMLLTAFAIASRDGLPADVSLVCTGAPGPRRDELVASARAMGLAERVSFPGFVERAELERLVAGAVAMVFPSLYEGFGLPVVEAMARGTPVACSDATSLPEVAGDAALLFDPRKPQDTARAMTRLIDDAALRERLSAAGRARAVAFTDAQRMAAEYWSLFEEAAAA